MTEVLVIENDRLAAIFSTVRRGEVPGCHQERTSPSISILPVGNATVRRAPQDNVTNRAEGTRWLMSWRGNLICTIGPPNLVWPTHGGDHRVALG